MSEKTYTLTIDIDKMTLGDLEILENASRGEFKPFLDLLERAGVVDGLANIRQIPIRDLGDVVGQLTGAIGNAGNSGN